VSVGEEGRAAAHQAQRPAGAVHLKCVSVCACVFVCVREEKCATDHQVHSWSCSFEVHVPQECLERQQGAVEGWGACKRGCLSWERKDMRLQ